MNPVAEVVLDASALLALMWREPGSERVAGASAPRVSAVNWAEVIQKLTDRGMDDVAIPLALDALECRVEPFDRAAAVRTGLLRRRTRARGLSLGDNACLELAVRLGLPVLTADRAWGELDLGVEVVLIR